MDGWRTLFYLVPYLLSLAISFGIGVYAWRRRAVVGAGPYAVLALAQASWTLGYIFELVSPSLESKVFWDNSQFVGMLVAPLALLAFALEYTGRKLAHPRHTWGLLATVPIISWLLVFTDWFHGLIRRAVWLIPGEPFPELTYDFSPAIWLMAAYAYVLALVSLFLLLGRLVRSLPLFRAQVGVVVIGILVPIAGTILTVMGAAPAFHRDMTPFTFALGNLIVAWGLFRYRLFDVVPVARDTVIENMSDAVVVLDAQDRVVDLNPAARRAIGHIATDVIGQAGAQVSANWPGLVERFQDVTSMRTEISVEVEGERRHFEVSFSSLHDRRGRLTGRLIVVHDITARVQAEEVLRQARDELEQRVHERTAELHAANEQLQGEIAERRQAEKERRRLEEQFRQAQKMEALGRLAGGVAHDFNNLLTVLHISTRMLQRNLHAEDPLLEHVRRIRDTGERAARLTGQLLSFSRREIIEPRVLNLNQIVGNLSRMLQRILGEDVRLTTALADDLWPVQADPSQMDQVIVNLAINARDAMPEGGTLTIETANVVLDEDYTALHVEAQRGEHVLLTVSDTGVGMDVEVKARIFEPFFTTKERGQGTGLGLATVFGIVKQNGGHIEVYSEVGQGTTFKIYLPRTTGPASDVRCAVDDLETDILSLERRYRGTETVLLVEDDASVRELAVRVLESCGYRVLAAGDGLQALQISEQHDSPIHLLLTDVVLPQTSGKELAEQLQSARPKMQVLYTSGYTDDAIAQYGVLAPGVFFLPKPFTVEDLTRRVREVLDKEA